MSREYILKKIKENKPSLKELPVIANEKFIEELNLKETFKKNLEAAGGRVKIAEDKNEIISVITNLAKDFNNIISFVDYVNVGTINPEEIISTNELDTLELAIIEGQFGIAENGAVWISDQNFNHRSIPFITLHLFLILNENEIVENMHEVYTRLSSFDEGYGVFISGPSKTADIEQSLVIGAQGPLSATIFLIK
jgi:L-lactate dehydrogenase complex protein LldG